MYTAPFIWIQPPNCEIKEDNGRFKCFDRFEVSEIDYNEHREINRLVIINSKTRNVVYEFGTAASEPQKGPSNRPKRTADKIYAQHAKTPENRLQGAVTATEPVMATQEQIEYIKTNANDDDYANVMTMYGAELENMTADQADAAIAEINAHNAAPIDTVVTCERCGNAITGVALPDGTMMTAAELIGKSKLTYGGVYCWNCAKELSKAKKSRKAG